MLNVFSLGRWRRKSWMLYEVPSFNGGIILSSIGEFSGIKITRSRTWKVTLIIGFLNSEAKNELTKPSAWCWYADSTLTIVHSLYFVYMGFRWFYILENNEGRGIWNNKGRLRKSNKEDDSNYIEEMTMEKFACISSWFNASPVDFLGL